MQFKMKIGFSLVQRSVYHHSWRKMAVGLHFNLGIRCGQAVCFMLYPSPQPEASRNATCILEVLLSHLCWYTNHPERGLVMVSLSTSKQMSEQCFKLGHDRFLPHPIEFITHNRPITPLYIVKVTDSVTNSMELGPS
jgi:hypothetical protein